MLKLGDRYETQNPAQFLAGEAGTFNVWTPGGEVQKFECAPGHSISSIETVETGNQTRANYLIEKIGEPVPFVGSGAARVTKAR